MNASKLFISEECVQKHVWILCIHVVLSHHILGFPWWRESVTGICRQWVKKMASVDLSYSSFLHLLLLCSPIWTLPPLTVTPYLPQSPSFLALLEVLHYPGFSPPQPAPTFSSLTPDPLPSLQLQTLPTSSPAHFLGLLDPLSLSSPTPSSSPRLSVGSPINLINPFSYLPRKVFFKLHSSTPLTGVIFQTVHPPPKDFSLHVLLPPSFSRSCPVPSSIWSA